MVTEFVRPLVDRQLEVLTLGLGTARVTLPETLHELARRCRNGAASLRKAGREHAADQLAKAGELLAAFLQLAQPTEEVLRVVTRMVDALKNETFDAGQFDWDSELDALHRQLDAVETSSPSDRTPAVQAAVATTTTAAKKSAGGCSEYSASVEMAATFIEEANFQLQTIEVCLCTLASGHRSVRTFDRLLRHVHALKGLASFAGHSEISRTAHAMEEVLQLVRNGFRPCDDEALAAMFRSHDWICARIESLSDPATGSDSQARPQPHSEILDLISCCVPTQRSEAATTTTTASPEVRQALNDQLKQPVVEAKSETETPTPAEVAKPATVDKRASADSAAVRAKESTSNAATAAAAQTVKVDRGKLEELVDLIGELALGATLLEAEWRQVAPRESQHSPTMSRVRKLCRELHARGLSLRAVPIDGLFRRMGRVVFDLSRKIGKPTQLVIEGGETEIDKTIIDQVGDPLMHLIRNSMDHGIETSTRERVAAGKPEQATVTLRAAQRGGSVYIEVQDDGRGLNRARIRQKAIERGLISIDRTLSDDETCRLIFHPGFSTAEKLTEISGRGVGMDVVKQNIDALNGSIDVRSEEGVGMTVSLRLPLTLAMLDGLVVRIGSDRFVVPIARVRETVPLAAEQTESAIRRGHRLAHRGCEFFCKELGELLHVPIDATMRRIGMICEVEGDSVCLLVDEVLGRQQVAVKPLSIENAATRRFAGGAILADGQLALVLEMDQLRLPKTSAI